MKTKYIGFRLTEITIARLKARAEAESKRTNQVITVNHLVREAINAILDKK